MILLPPNASPEIIEEKSKVADALLERVKTSVKTPEDFAKFATEHSEDPNAKRDGGDLDFFTKESMVPEFADAAFKMKKGELSAKPVRTQYGFHIIQVTERKDASKVPLEQIKARIIDHLNNDRERTGVQALIKDLREKSKVEVRLE